ncbi:hypothetical protein DFP72DRAFT_938495 [Ephemerocybe angulata]|uniref:Secreted protein n=1 Tax=Ephemerocybe angulata TaxID=980116 RepID=A0A8H6HA23_9AGAR|nr:hypothetical protein DFP72DRAFT_938495 [Tulosesus angulatus]
MPTPAFFRLTGLVATVVSTVKSAGASLAMVSWMPIMLSEVMRSQESTSCGARTKPYAGVNNAVASLSMCATTFISAQFKRALRVVFTTASSSSVMGLRRIEGGRAYQGTVNFGEGCLHFTACDDKWCLWKRSTSSTALLTAPFPSRNFPMVRAIPLCRASLNFFEKRGRRNAFRSSKPAQRMQRSATKIRSSSVESWSQTNEVDRRVGFPAPSRISAKRRVLEPNERECEDVIRARSGCDMGYRVVESWRYADGRGDTGRLCEFPMETCS